MLDGEIYVLDVDVEEGGGGPVHLILVQVGLGGSRGSSAIALRSKGLGPYIFKYFCRYFFFSSGLKL